MVGNNTPVFFIRDPIKFPDFIHTQKRNPQTNLKDPDMFWDFLSLVPESIHQVTILFSDRGTPDVPSISVRLIITKPLKTTTIRDIAIWTGSAATRSNWFP